MRMYLVVTTYTDDAPFYLLYKTHTVAVKDFWSRVGRYVHDWLIVQILVMVEEYLLKRQRIFLTCAMQKGILNI